MAWTRAGQVGGEMRSTDEWFSYGGSGQPSISSTKAYTGTYSVRYMTYYNNSTVGKAFASVAQMRAGVWLNHNGLYRADGKGYILSWGQGSTPTGGVYWDAATSTIKAYHGADTFDSVADSTGSFTTVNQWFHAGVIVNCDASDGWVSFYLDGTKILSGTSLNTGTGLTSAYFGGGITIGAWASDAYFDDFYVDTATGSEIDEAPPFYRFGWRVADAVGTNSEWTPSSGGDNYADVDEVPHDSDTTYVQAGSSGLQDSYDTSSFALPSGYTITAEIPTVVAKKTGASEQIKLGFEDGANQSLSAALDLSAGYSTLFSRHTAQPDTTDWNETDGDAMEVLIESAGTYS